MAIKSLTAPSGCVKVTKLDEGREDDESCSLLSSGFVVSVSFFKVELDEDDDVTK